MQNTSSRYKMQIDMTKLFVCGSCTIIDKRWVFSKIDECIANNHFADVTILEGTANGVDEIAKEWAIEHNTPVIEYPPDVKHYLYNACHKRNEAMAKDCDYMLALWTGNSTGTLHDIFMAEKYYKPYEIFIYNSRPFIAAAENVIKCNKEIFSSSENPKKVLQLFKNAVYKELINNAYIEPEWEEGHNSGSSFWIMPVKQGKDSSDGDWGCYCCLDEEISIEEDIIYIINF